MRPIGAPGENVFMLRRLYDWTMDLAGHRHALWVLAAVAFIESSVFPVPPDVLIIPMVLAARGQAWRIAAVATVASVVGGGLGYLIGAALFETLGRPLLEFYGQMASFDEFRRIYDEWGAWIVAGAGFTPFPYKVVTIASGVADLDPVTFMAASAVSRGARFFLVAALLWKFGPPIRIFIENYLPYLAAAFFILLIGGFVALRYLF
jgi:membrane protein YqaA with SNARE-associated domain